MFDFDSHLGFAHSYSLYAAHLSTHPTSHPFWIYPYRQLSGSSIHPSIFYLSHCEITPPLTVCLSPYRLLPHVQIPQRIPKPDKPQTLLVYRYYASNWITIILRLIRLITLSDCQAGHKVNAYKAHSLLYSIIQTTIFDSTAILFKK